jgi:deazaflavin-dependent oxidoreductase (nitroreductase family)
MPTKIRDVQLPRGVTRALYRLPIRLFQLHLGWLLMGHFLLLTHIGRKSGLPRQTVLEVLPHDRAKDEYYVMAGWGERSDWVKNIEKTPQLRQRMPWRVSPATTCNERCRGDSLQHKRLSEAPGQIQSNTWRLYVTTSRCE